MEKGAEFQACVRACLDSLHNYARLLARPPEDHEDLLQDSLIRAFRGFDSFDRALPFKAWMFGVIRNTYIDRYRRRKVRPLEQPLDDEELSASRTARSIRFLLPPRTSCSARKRSNKSGRVSGDCRSS